jgi:hypothetical protein
VITLHDAVHSAYPSAVVCRITADNVITAFDTNEQPIEINQSTVMAKLAELQDAEQVAEQAAKDAKASALAKLAALGLTQDEVKALVG